MQSNSNFFERIGRWLDRLFDKLVDWIGRHFIPVVKKLINFLKRIWEPFLEAALLAAYGFIKGLYVIFYYCAELSRFIAEFFDPKNPKKGTIKETIEGIEVVEISKKITVPKNGQFIKDQLPQYKLLSS